MASWWLFLTLVSLGNLLSLQSMRCYNTNNTDWPKVNGFAQPDRVVFEGTNATIVCGARAFLYPIESIRINTKSHSKRCWSDGKTPLTQCTYALPNITTDLSGLVRCYASDTFACRKYSFSLEVINTSMARSPTVNVFNPSGVYLTTINKSLQLVCNISGLPPPRVTWLKDNITLTSFSLKRDFNGSVYSVLSKVSLKGVSKEDVGIYKCEAENGYGVKLSRTVRLIIDKPVTKEKLLQVTASKIPMLYLVVGTIALVLLVVIIVLVIVHLQFKRHRNREDRLPAIPLKPIKNFQTEHIAEDEDHVGGDKDIGLVSPCMNEDESDEEKNESDEIIEYKEIPRDSLEMLSIIGCGQFGKIMSAVYQDVNQNNAIKVAVKMPREDNCMTAEDISNELLMLKKVGCHKNIVNVIGTCTEKDPVYIVLEYVPNGDLRTFLIKHRVENISQGYINVRCLLNERQLLRIAVDIASGMKYLASRKCVHRDLAARNILLGANYEAKLTDFGLARDIQKGHYIRTKECVLPVKWMAPESLVNMKCSIESDVWSFGIVLWEIIMLGETPYPDIETLESLTYKLIHENYRMPRPTHCSRDLYNVMLKCWAAKPEERINFKTIYRILKHMLEDDLHTYVNISVKKQTENNGEIQ